jgi:hypothetical protein
MIRTLHTARKITPLIRSIVFGVAGVAAISAVTAVVAGCEDENQPEYYTKRLNDPALRPAAVKRLVQFFEDAMTRADKKRDDPKVKELLDKIVPPLTKTYMESQGDDRTRAEILKLLADTRDVRAKDAWIKALKDYQPNVGEPEAKSAIQAIAETKVTDQAAMDAIIGVFVKLEASSPKGQLIYLDFKNAMVEIASPGWKPQLLERLNRPMEMVSQADKGTNEDKIRAYQNEQFWQTTAAELLGIIKASDAVKPLFKTVLDPNKADVAATAIMAMVKIGKDSMNVLIDSLLGKDAEINEFAKTVVKDKKEVEVTVVRSAALVIGTLGRADGVTPLLTALGKADSKDHITRAILARELAKLPASPESLKAFIDVMQNMPASAVIPPGAPAVATLEESIASYYDSSVIDVLIKLGNDIKGEADDKQVVRDAALATIIKLMRKDQVPAVEKLIGDWAPKENDSKLEKEAFKKAKGLLDACGDKVECYLAKIEEAAVQEKDQQFVGIKATYMLGILGNDSTRMEITKRLQNIKNPAIKYAAVQAIDHLAPSGDKAVADEMKRIMDANIAKGDANLILGDNPVKQVMFRLLARQ